MQKTNKCSSTKYFLTYFTIH